MVSMENSRSGVVENVGIQLYTLEDVCLKDMENNLSMSTYKTYTKLNGSVAKVPYIDISCKYCGSKNVIKWGNFRGIQRFFCKDCQRKFADNDALPNMQTPTEQVGAALSMYYEGHSLNKVRRLLSQIYNSYPSDSSVYRWLSRFTKEAI